MMKRRVAIPPDSTLMEDIGATSFSVADAIIELLANSIDARIGEERLSIEILVGPSEIVVVDDGAGMEAEILADAVRLGVKMDAITGSSRKRKGMYGLGMKTAAASLGRRWAVHTRPVDEAVEHRVEFDLEEWRRHAGSREFDWSIELEQRNPEPGGPLGDRPHGTAIVITKVRERDPLPGPVLDKIGQAYKPHIEAGDIITVNGERATPREYTYFPESYTEIDIDLDEGRRITGWVALDTRTHNDDLFGLNLFREGQLVEAWNKDWFKVHLMTSRIIGEVHLDFVQANFHKQGFEKTTVEWKLTSNAMVEFLKPVARASREMARGRKDETRFARALDGLQRATGKATELGDLSSGHDPGGSTAAQDGAADDDTGGTQPQADDEVLLDPETLRVDGRTIKLVFEVQHWETEQTPWDHLFDERSNELLATVNSNSLLFRKVKDESFLGMLALADSVSAFLIERCGFDPDQARSIRDRWLHASLEG